MDKMTPTSKVIQVVKSHDLSVRFPYRKDSSKLSASAALQPLLFPVSSIILYHCEVSTSPGWLLGQELPDTVKIIKSLSHLRNTEGNLHLKKKWTLSRMIIVIAICHQNNYLSSKELPK